MARNAGRILLCLMVLIAVSFASCSTQYAAYSNQMFLGKKLFQDKEYKKAMELFIQASQAKKDSASLALLGSSYYKMGDIENADSYIKEAERVDKNSYYRLRILGYKALIMLKQNKPEGFDGLKQYTVFVKEVNLPFEMHDINMMLTTQKIDFALLEAKIEEQATWYESEMEKFDAGEPNYFSEKYGRPI